MTWMNPSAKIVAHRIDRMFQNEKGKSYYTLAPLDPAKQKKNDAVTDQMHTYLQQKWLQHAAITSQEDRLNKVRGNANDVLKHLQNPAASSMVSRAADSVLDQLDFRATHGIPLHASVVPNYTPAAALSVPPSDAGNALGRSASFAGSALSGPPDHVNGNAG